MGIFLLGGKMPNPQASKQIVTNKQMSKKTILFFVMSIAIFARLR